MTIGIIFLCTIDVLLIALTGLEFGRMRAMRLDIEKLYDAISQLAHDYAKSKKNAENFSKAINELNGKIDAAAKTQEEAAEAIGKQLEKKWDAGLQNMLSWNPFGKGES